MIRAIEIYKMSNEKERRGPLVAFHTEDNNITHDVILIQKIVSTLHLSYTFAPGECGEQMECFFVKHTSGLMPGFYIRHKYWTQIQIDCFMAVILELAKLYKWEIEG
jgi:hypothetical protein